jgi:hypothetical protein
MSKFGIARFGVNFFGASETQLLSGAGNIPSVEGFGLHTISPGPVTLTGAGNISSTAALGLLTVNPGPVTISAAGNIPTAEAWGSPWIVRIPAKLALGANIRRLCATPQIRRLKVTPDG